MEAKSDHSRRTGAEPSEIALELVDGLDVLLAYWDTDQVCRFANQAYMQWFGKSRQEAIGLTMEQLLGPALYPRNLPYILGALRDGQVQIFEREIPCADGKTRHSLANYTPDIVDGQIRGMFVHVADVTPLKRLQRELEAAKARAEHLATHDFLTGLPNRVLLLDRIEQAVVLAKRREQMLAVISLDVDDFKGVNDTYGHAAGDQLLIEIAARLLATLRESDTATRLGGDEFLLLAPEIARRDQVEAMAERMLTVMQAPVALGSDLVRCTFSMGLALYPQDGMTAEGLMANSDRALYSAKKLGKNRYAFYTSAPDRAPG